MIKKIRWRFIWAAMVAFFLVVLLLGSLVNIVNYCVVTRRNDETIDYILDFESKSRADGRGQRGVIPPGMPFGGLPDEEANYMTRFFIVALDSDNIVIAKSMDYVASISDSDAVAYTDKAISKMSSRGYIDGYRYARFEYEDATLIVFLNSTREIQSMESLLLMTIVISLGSLILVFLLVFLLSKRAIRPIAQNMELQKRFITDAGHELKTPLTSISTSLDVIEMEHGNDEWTANIRRQIGRLKGLVGELVTLSKLDEVKPVNTKEETDLTAAAWEIVEVHMPQVKASGKEIITNIDDNIIIRGDRSSIQQMLSVLIDNAIKYSDGREPVRINIHKSHGKANIIIYNSCDYQTPPDTGRLFERFYRPDESRNSSTGGNGIGLAIAKSVAEAHGGRISASCPDGKHMTITAEI